MIYGAGTEAWFWIGSLLFVLSVLLDRADGLLARMKGQTSDAGHRLDLVADFTVNALVFIGIGIGIKDGPLGYWSIAAGVYSGLAISAIFLIVTSLETRSGARAGELPGFAGFDADDAVLLIPAAISFGYGAELLIASVAGTTIALLFFAAKLARRPSL